MRQYCVFIMLVFTTVSGYAQDTLSFDTCRVEKQHTIRGIVADMLTKTPQRDVQISLNTGHSVTTPWDGTFVIDDSLFSSATITRSGYLVRRMNREEFSDTIFLLPSERLLGEVEVWGRKPDREGLNRQISSLDAILIANGQNLSFSPLGLVFYLLNKSGLLPDSESKARRKKEKLKAILDNY